MKASSPKGSNPKGKKKGGMPSMSIKGGIMSMLGGFTVLRLTGMLGMMKVSFTKEELLKMNKQLNKIRKPAKKS